MKQLVKSIVVSLLLVSVINAEAATISLSPTSQNIQVGDQLSLDVFYDMGVDISTGGAFSVNFDNSAFDFSSFVFDSGLGDDSAFRVFPTTPVNDNVFNLGFGSFDGLTGSGKIGILTFQSNQEGTFDFTLADPVLQGTITHDSFPNPIYIDSQVQVAPVPLPAAAWLLMSGISVLGLMTRRKLST